MTALFSWANKSTLPLFIKCLESLPNLHTLEIGSLGGFYDTTLLKNALKHVELPQVKTLTLPLAAHPLLQHCHNVEDVAFVSGHGGLPSNEFFESLASNRDSKVKQLAIPLVPWTNPSRRLFSTLWARRVKKFTHC